MTSELAPAGLQAQCRALEAPRQMGDNADLTTYLGKANSNKQVKPGTLCSAQGQSYAQVHTGAPRRDTSNRGRGQKARKQRHRASRTTDGHRGSQEQLQLLGGKGRTWPFMGPEVSGSVILNCSIT